MVNENFEINGDSAELERTTVSEIIHEALRTKDATILTGPIFERAKKELKETLGVDDLSTIEALRLRKIVQEVNKQLIDEGEGLKNPTDTGFNPATESVARWLNELYGINHIDIPTEEGKTTNDFREYLRRIRNRAHTPELE